MGKRRPTIWRLFVDESGDFSDSEDEVVVAGLLLREGTPGANPSQIRASLQRDVPEIPWPIKASELNFPVVFALAREHRCGSGGLPDEIRRLLVALRNQLSGDYDAVSAAVEASKRLPYDSVSRLDRFARKESAAYVTLRAMADRASVAVGRLIASFGSESNGGAVVVGCGETRLGEIGASDDNEVDLATARYLTLLEWLFVRVADVLSRREGEHEVHLHILERDVSDRQLGRPSPLHLRHVGPLMRAAEELVRMGAKKPRITIKPEEVVPFNDRVHAGLVLADFVANRARAALRSRSGALAGVEDVLVRILQCRVRSGEPGASHLAAAGSAQRLIEVFRRGEELTEGFPLVPDRRWPTEQATEWMEVLRR